MDVELPPITYANSIPEAARHLGIHTRTLSAWIHEGAPEKTNQGYDIEAIRQWRRITKHKNKLKLGDKERFTMADGDGDEELADRMAAAKLKELEGRANKISTEAVIAEYKRKLMAEGLVHRDAVNNFLARVLSSCRDQIQKIPPQFAAGYAPDIQREMERDLSQRIDIVLRALRVQLEDTRDIENDD